MFSRRTRVGGAAPDAAGRIQTKTARAKNCSLYAGKILFPLLIFPKSQPRVPLDWLNATTRIILIEMRGGWYC